MTSSLVCGSLVSAMLFVKAFDVATGSLKFFY